MDLMSLLQTATPEQTTKIHDSTRKSESEALATPGANEPLLGRIAARIQRDFERALTAKQSSTINRLLDCRRLRNGKYSPTERVDITAQGGSDVFVNLTNVKCRAAESWIRDVMFHSGRAWTLEPTPIPDLPTDVDVAVLASVKREQEEVLAQGEEVMPEAFTMRLAEMRQDFLDQLQEEARKRVSAMEDLIADELDEGGWDKALSEFITDFVTYPAAIIKGPIYRKKRQVSWQAGIPVVKETVVKVFERVSPMDVYPSPDSTSCQNGSFVQRHRLFPMDLQAMKGTPHYSDLMIDEALKVYGNGYVVTRAWDDERDRQEGREGYSALYRNTIECLQYWGAVKGSELKEWGEASKVAFPQINDNEYYEIEAWLVGRLVIKAVINPDEMGRRPYEKACWEDVPGAFWGSCPPEIMADVQRMINACARAMSNNLAIASGPQVEVNIDRLPTGVSNIDSLYPWKVWQTRSDRTGGQGPAVTFFQPNSNAQELQNVMEWFYRKADEVTGIPNYTYGSGQTGGAGRTASGLSMLMEAASKGIKQAISNIDTAVTAVIAHMYAQNLLTSGDPSVRGDCQVVAKGTLGLIQREAVQQRRQEFMMATANPMDAQIIGVEGRGYLLNEMAKGLGMDANKIVPDPEKLRAMVKKQEEAAAQQQAMMMAQQAGMQGPPGAPPGEMPPEGLPPGEGMPPPEMGPPPGMPVQ